MCRKSFSVLDRIARISLKYPDWAELGQSRNYDFSNTTSSWTYIIESLATSNRIEFQFQRQIQIDKKVTM